MQSRTASGQIIEAWQQRQKKDGGLVTALAITSTIPAVRFFCSPDAASAWVLMVFLVALGLAILRLIQSASTVVNLRPSSLSPSVPARAQIMGGYENLADYDALQVQSVAGCWMAPQYSAQGTDSHPLCRHSLN
ncbi:MAG TPA: hypothetical protein VFD66_14885 [Verrucomicrobiae bacterium]|nr:hypothetical protein [Verrucomicrobiae bacterium]